MQWAEQRIDAAIGRIYDAAADLSLLPQLLTDIADLTGAIGANMIFEDNRSVAATWFRLGRLDGELLQTHLRRHHESLANPWTQAARHQAVGVAPMDGVVPRGELERTAYYEEILAPQGILHHLCAVLRNDDGGNLRVGVFRSTAAGPGDAGDIRLLVHLAPHLTRAVDLAGKFEALALAQRGVLDAVGASGRAVVVLDTEGRVLLASPPAEAILAAGDGLDAPGGRPAAWLARQSARLDRLIAAATAGRSSGVVVVARRSGQVPYVVTVAPLRRPQHWPLQSMPSAVLLVGDLGRLAGDAAAPLVRLYGLSPMQARVAVAIAGGDGLARVASSLGVSLNTARSHLQQALRKTGMRNQVALAALVTRAADLPDPALSS